MSGDRGDKIKRIAWLTGSFHRIARWNEWEPLHHLPKLLGICRDVAFLVLARAQGRNRHERRVIRIQHDESVMPLHEPVSLVSHAGDTADDFGLRGAQVYPGDIALRKHVGATVKQKEKRC